MRLQTDCVILAGTIGNEADWTAQRPRPLLPLPGTTLIESLVSELTSRADGTCVICANGHTHKIATRIALTGSADGRVGYFEDNIPCGAAGCIKAAERSLSSDEFLVVSGSVRLGVDPDRLVKLHRESNNVMTVFCTRDSDLVGASTGSRLRPAGVYCCDRTVLGFIKPSGYQDLKEQLTPALQAAGHRVGAIALDSKTCEVTDWNTYLAVLDDVLSADFLEVEGYDQLAPGIWRGRDVKIAPDARIAGPAFIGHGSRIESGAVLVGPTMLGEGCRVGQGSWLVRVIAPDRCEIKPGSSMADRLLPLRDHGVASVSDFSNDRPTDDDDDSKTVVMIPGSARFAASLGGLATSLAGLLMGSAGGRDL